MLIVSLEGVNDFALWSWKQYTKIASIDFKNLHVIQNFTYIGAYFQNNSPDFQTQSPQEDSMTDQVTDEHNC